MIPNWVVKFCCGIWDIYFNKRELELFIFNRIGFINSVIPLICDLFPDNNDFLYG
jgi:hypothetical protein